MINQGNPVAADRLLVGRLAHVVERTGLAMAGATCGTFVSAQLLRAGIAILDPTAFVASMILIGAIGFYLGIDIPNQPFARSDRKILVELLSAIGTFLAAIAALVCVYTMVADEVPQRLWEFMVGGWWLAGVMMQIGAGSLARLRAA